MATVKGFEDIEAWKKARNLNQTIFQIILTGDFARDYELKGQINRSSGSIMDNIAEGFERGGRAEFIQFLGFAKGSTGEVKSQLYRAYDRNYISKEKLDEPIEINNELAKMIMGFINYLNKSTIKGDKFKGRDF